MQTHKKFQQGFTLIELLVVISIIGVLTSLSLIGVRKVRFKSQEVQIKSDLRSINNGLEMYAAENSEKYPIPDTTSEHKYGNNCEKLATTSSTTITLDLVNIPKLDQKNYIYCYTPNIYRITSPTPDGENFIVQTPQGVSEPADVDFTRFSPSILFNGLRNANGSTRNPIPDSTYIDCGTSPDIAGTGPFSVSVWVRRDRNEPPPVDPETWTPITDIVSPRDFIISQGKGMFGDYYVFLNSYDQVILRTWGYDQNMTGAAGEGVDISSGTTKIPYNDKKWHHIVVTRDDTGLNGKMWIDGTEVTTALPGQTLPTTHKVYLTPGPMKNSGDDNGMNVFTYIGKMSWQRNIVTFDKNRTWPFKGNIDEVRTYTKTLTDADVQRLYKEEIPTGPTDSLNQSLKAYWKFDETTGDTISDFSGNNYTCTAKFATWDDD